MSARSSIQRFHIPSYNRNAVVQLIALSGLGFIIIHLIWITLIVYAVPEQRSFALTFEYIGLGSLDRLKSRWWTMFAYGWCHRGFWEWLSSIMWLYAFGNVVQNLVGYKQIIPLFVYGVVAGGLAFAGVQLLPAALMPDNAMVMGAQGGIMALMAAALTLSPKYRIYLSDYFSIPLLLLAGIFILLMIINSNFEIATISLLAAGAAVGFVYIKLLQNGFQPGAWAYRLYNKMDTVLSPPITTKARGVKPLSEQAIDNILDKINEKGYHSLSQSEKDQLRETSR
jgi:membrane associated rhomboid family serine protease